VALNKKQLQLQLKPQASRVHVAVAVATHLLEVTADAAAAATSLILHSPKLWTTISIHPPTLYRYLSSNCSRTLSSYIKPSRTSPSPPFSPSVQPPRPFGLSFTSPQASSDTLISARSRPRSPPSAPSTMAERYGAMCRWMRMSQKTSWSLSSAL
jgi:hypothetical protein